MDKKFKKKLAEEKAYYEELKYEPHFSAEDFTAEIAPLLCDYFRGEFTLNGKTILCTFANGQKFSIKTDEV